MKTIKSLTFIALLLAVSFTSCKKDEPNNGEDNKLSAINATVENGAALNTQIDSVYLVIEGKDSRPISKAKFTNGEFSLKLEPVSPDALEPLDEDMINNYTVSDKTVKTNHVKIIYAVKGGKRVGDLMYTNAIVQNGEITSEDYKEIYYMYVDKPLTVTGTYKAQGESRTLTYNIRLKTGWNIVTGSDLGNTRKIASIETTTGFKWHYFPD